MMAKPTRAGYKQLATEVPEDVIAMLRSLAERNGRSIAAELIHAVRRHCKYPPDLSEPPMPPRDAPDTPRPRKRRPAGGAGT